MAAAAFAYRAKQANSSSDSDSDDSDRERNDWKRATRKQGKSPEKIPIDPVPPQNEIPTSTTQSTKRKRNNIWCEVLEDQLLSESLNHCGVKQKPKGYGDRGEESYDYTLGRKYYKKDEVSEDEEERMSDGDVSDSTETCSVTSSVRERRFNDKKYVKLDSAGLHAARKIVKKLGEQKPYLIFRVVKYVGAEKAMELLKKTEDVEESGGMMIKNNSRRRTPGGVYFQLLKSDPAVTKAAVDKVFEGELNSFEAKRLLEEKRKKNKERKKQIAAGKRAEQAALKDSELSLPLPITFSKPQTKQEDSVVKMEEDPTSVEDLPNVSNSISNTQETKEDLEDGEIDD